MLVAIKLAYAAAVACLLVLVVVFGIRAVDDGPDTPQFPGPPPPRPPVAATPAAPDTVTTPTVLEPAAQEQARYEQAQREYQDSYARYEGRRRDYRRNVFLLSCVVAVATGALGAYLWRRSDAIALGFLAGGFAMLVYAVAQAGSDLDEIGATLVFVVALAGLVIVLAAGSRWLSNTR